MSNERYEGIKRTVTWLFVRYKVSCIPINSFEIAVKIGAKVIPYSAYPLKTRLLLLKKSEDGFCIEKENGEWFIFYNDYKPYGRINNTLMHEIGHIVLDHTEDSELAESEVKFFAKYALAPPVLIHKLSLSNPLDISNTFDISLEAAQYAYNYYLKWLRYGGIEYKQYEVELLCQFETVV